MLKRIDMQNQNEETRTVILIDLKNAINFRGTKNYSHVLTLDP